ncbi:uncharacterized protein [Prorops nasuta]|uniref:uncharacterized protein n=1 Tax=Prorops nasuta TaxID=863751 RepID=UPI0034CF4AA7
MENVLNNVIDGAPNNDILTLPEIVKMARHLELVHPEEADVKTFLKLRKNSKERSKLIAEIRKKRDYNYNTKETVNTGNLIVRRLPNKHKNRSTNDYIACANCKGHYMRSNIRHHFVKCTNYAFKGERSTNVLCRMIDGKLHESANKVVKKEIFPYIQDGPIKDAIRYDELLILYANILSEKYSHENFSMIRSKLRFFGRFLIAVKEMSNEILDFASIYRPKYFKYCLKAASIVAGYDEDVESFKAPTNILALGNILKQIGKFLETLYIEREDKDKQKMTKDFIKLIAQGFQIINQKALEAQNKRNRQKKINLPSTNDIVKLNTFLEENRTSTYKKLQQKYTYNHWLFLSEICVIELQLFNRLRQGEFSKATISDFESCQGFDKEQKLKMYNSLTKKCQEASNSYMRFTIRGKLGRTVTVLIHKAIQKCMNLILKYRSEAGISQRNEYLFALPSLDENRQHKHIIACDVLRKFSEKCGACSPQTLRGTTLRKQIATMGAHLKLGEQEISDLANYLGHANEIHKKYYRQPLISREICQMSQILETATPSLKKRKQNLELNYSDIYNEIESKLAEEEIDDPSSLLEETVNNSENKTPMDGSAESEFNYDDEDSEDNEKNRSVNKKHISKSFIPRIRWSEKENNVVQDVFRHHLGNNTLPSAADCNKLIEKCKSIFNNKRTGAQVKAYINNQNKKRN